MPGSYAKPQHAVIVLAAGSSKRLGQPKQLVRQRNVSLIRSSAIAALATSPAEAVVVIGAHAQAVSDEVADLGLRAIICSNFESGMSASIRAGVSALSAECAGALIVLCDQPALNAQHLQQICALWRDAPQCAVVSGYAGRRGVPALLPRTWFNALLQLSGDRGARDLINARACEIAIVLNEALAFDVDNTDDLAMLR